jgi:hypothetical protein
MEIDGGYVVLGIMDEQPRSETNTATRLLPRSSVLLREHDRDHALGDGRIGWIRRVVS